MCSVLFKFAFLKMTTTTMIKTLWQ